MMINLKNSHPFLHLGLKQIICFSWKLFYVKLSFCPEAQKTFHVRKTPHENLLKNVFLIQL